jgi:fructose-1,6-bisphosphatase-3
LAVSFGIEELTSLRALAYRYPSAADAIAEIAVLRATLSLPKDTVHVFSDVHGEYKKLRHIINNASGSLRPLVSKLFSERLTADEQRELLAVLYYPRETIEHLRPALSDTTFRRAWVRRMLRLQFEIVRGLARWRRRSVVRDLFPAEAKEICEELLTETSSGRDPRYINEMIEALAEHERDLAAVRMTSRLVSDTEQGEIILQRISSLERLVLAYEEGALPESTTQS